MGERKVINKYHPPDFNPAKIPRRRQPKNKQMKVRMMLPMSIQCLTCGNYIYRATKFNSRKEDVIGEQYLGIQIFRFYFKCTKCSAEITMKTDPQNSDYVVESRATRNFEPWRAEDEATGEEKRKRESEEMGDSMKSLENRTLDWKREMDIMAALEEMKSMRSRHANVSVDAMLEALQRTAPVQVQGDNLEEEALLKSLFHGSKEFVRRIDDELMFSTIDDSEEALEKLKKRKISQEHSDSPTDCLTKASTFDRFNNKDDSAGAKSTNGGKFIFKSSSVKVSVMKKQPEVSKTKPPVGVEKEKLTSSGLQTLCQQYDSDEDD